MRKLILSFVGISLLICYCSKESHGIDLANMDLSTDQTQDFYQYANGGWIKSNTIPESESRWGVFNEISDTNKKALRSLLNELSKSDHDPGTIAQKVGDFYRTSMNLEQIEKTGLSPLKPYLDEIDAIRNSDDVLNVVLNQQKIGCAPLFTLSVDGDFKNSEMNIAYVDQAGLGMPDRDYYLEKEKGSKHIVKRI